MHKTNNTIFTKLNMFHFAENEFIIPSPLMIKGGKRF